jgi:hypothetical protein
MIERVEITHLDGQVEYAEGDDIHVRDGVLHVWNRHYNTGASFLADVHAGSWPLASIRRWRRVQR